VEARDGQKGAAGRAFRVGIQNIFYLLEVPFWSIWQVTVLLPEIPIVNGMYLPSIPTTPRTDIRSSTFPSLCVPFHPHPVLGLVFNFQCCYSFGNRWQPRTVQTTTGKDNLKYLRPLVFARLVPTRNHVLVTHVRGERRGLLAPRLSFLAIYLLRYYSAPFVVYTMSSDMVLPRNGQSGTGKGKRLREIISTPPLASHVPALPNHDHQPLLLLLRNVSRPLQQRSSPTMIKWRRYETKSRHCTHTARNRSTIPTVTQSWRD
jgi:hypothetical protein